MGFWSSLSVSSPSSVRHRQRLLENPLEKSQLENRLKNLVEKNLVNQTKNQAVVRINQVGQTNQVSQTKSQEKSQERSQEKNQVKSPASQLENLAASQANQARSLAKSQPEILATSQASLERSQAKNQAKNQVKNQAASQVVETSPLGSQVESPARNN